MRFGLDLGGTKMEAVIIDDNGAIVWRERRPTPAADYKAIIKSIGVSVPPDRAGAQFEYSQP